MTRFGVLAAAAFVAAAPAAAQSLADRVDAVREGTVQFRFAPRPGVCANEDGGIRWLRSRRDVGSSFDRGPCVIGPAVVTLTRDNNEIVSIRLRIGVRPDQATRDLGDVSGSDAGKYLAALARRVSGRNADETLVAASIADGYDVWPDFGRVVLDDNVPEKTREQALFWLGQSDTPTANVTSLYAGLRPAKLREHYTFVLSQRRDDDTAIDQLIDVARRDRDLDVRKQAMFWLGQMHSDRATKFFREILTP